MSSPMPGGPSSSSSLGLSEMHTSVLSSTRATLLPFSRAIRAGDLVLVSGQLVFGPGLHAALDEAPAVLVLDAKVEVPDARLRAGS